MVKTSQLKALVRGDISLTEITNGINLLPYKAENDSNEYRISAEDIYAGVKHYDGKQIEDVYRWLNTILWLVD